MTAPARGNASRVSFDIDSDSFRGDIEQTAVFGSVGTEHGRGRTALPTDAVSGRARDYLMGHLEAVGPDVHIDTIGNIAGRWTSDSVDPDAAPVAAGSHLDSVPNGGIFDGSLGVYAAVEAVRSIRESNLTPAHPLEVVCFTSEERTRSVDGVLGSTVAARKRGVDETLALTDDDMTLEDALDRVGYRGSGRLDASAWDAWAELHIEQNTHLGNADIPLGIATDITGTARCHVPIEGQADHSGTTEMTARHDALAAASELVLEIERRAADVATIGNGTAVGTVGELNVEPDVVNIVPGAASLHLGLRSIDRGEIRLQLDAIERALDAIEAHRGMTTSFDCTYDAPSTLLSKRYRRVATEASRAYDIETLSLHSGASHNTVQVADVTDTAFVFVASENGHSHSPREQAGWADCTATTEVLAGTLVRLATTDDTEMSNIERN